jgi:hypothetical protein
MMMWQPIETAPKDNKRPLWLARFNDDGTMQSFDYNGSWESESESWEMPQVYYYWASESGNVEEPSHWAYQPEGFCVLGAQPAPSVPVDLITDYLVSISAHVAHQDDPKAQAEIGELLRMLASAQEAK